MNVPMKGSLLFICTLWFCSSTAFGTVGLEVTPGSWDIGAVPEGSVQTTWTASTPDLGGYFTVTHIGTDQWESVSIRCDNTPNWIAGTYQGPDVFILGWGQTVTMGTIPVFNRVTATDTVMIENLTASSSYHFDLEFGLPVPSSTTDQQQITVTLTASTPVGYVYCMSGDFWAKNTGNGVWSTDWSTAAAHTITEAEWKYLVSDNLFTMGQIGWTSAAGTGGRGMYWQVTSFSPPQTWLHGQDYANYTKARWVVLD